MKANSCAGKQVGPYYHCVITAKAGVNDNGSPEPALRLIGAASSAGSRACILGRTSRSRVQKLAIFADSPPVVVAVPEALQERPPKVPGRAITMGGACGVKSA